MGFSPFHYREVSASRWPCFEVLDWMTVDDGCATGVNIRQTIFELALPSNHTILFGWKARLTIRYLSCLNFLYC